MTAKLPWFKAYLDVKGEWRWTFYASNGKKVADSAEGYKNRQDCLHGIMLMKSYAPKAKVEGIAANALSARDQALANILATYRGTR